MRKNVAGQKIGAQMVSATDGSAFTGSVTVAVTGDAGTQSTGSVGSGACTHEGGGYHTYAPAQAETNYDLIAFTFTGTGAIPVTVQVYTGFDAITLATNNDKTGYSLSQTFPTNFSALSITAAGKVTVGTNDDKTGYSLSQSFPTNFASLVISGGGIVSADAVALSGDTTAADNAEAFFDGTGYAGTNNVIPLVTTTTDLTNLPTMPTDWITALGLSTGAVEEIRNAITGGAYDLDTDSNGRIRVVSGTGTGELDITIGTVNANQVRANGAIITSRDFVADVFTLIGRLTSARAGYLDNINNSALATTAAQTGDAYARIGAAGASLTAVPWNASWDDEVQSEVQDAIEVNNLDHLMKIAVDTDFATTVHLNSVIGHLADNGTSASFDRTTDALEAIRDRGDAAWTTGGSSTDWTSDERAAIRSILGIPASGTTPDDPSAGILDTIRDSVATKASQTSVDDLPTNAELATALAAADDAVLAQVALVKAQTDLIPASPAAVGSAMTLASDSITSDVLATSAVEELRNAITGGAYALDTDANGAVRIVDGTGARELNTSGGYIAGIAGTINTLDALDTAQDSQHTTTQSLVSALNNLSAAQVKTQVVAALSTDTYALPGAVTPSATPTLAAAIMQAFQQATNKTMQDDTTQSIYARDGSTIVQTRTVSDSGTVLTLGPVISA